MKISINKNIESLTPYQPGRPIEDLARELGIPNNTIAKLASNECPLGPSYKALDAMKKACSEMNYYPDGGAFFLRNKLSKHFGIDKEQFIFGNGSNEILELIGHCFVNEETSVIASEHAFIVYKLITKMFGGNLIEVPVSKGLEHNLDAMVEAITDDTRVIFICNPNNPTGTLLSQEKLDKFIAQVADNILIVFDEAYAEIVLDEMPDTFEYLKTKNNVIVLRTFSKAYGLAGLRIGYGIANQEIISILNKPRQPFNVNRIAQIAACAAIEDEKFVGEFKDLCNSSRNLFVDFCIKHNLEYIKPAANFILIKVLNGLDIFNKLQEKGIIVRPMQPYNLPEWIRISYGTLEENKKCLDALAELI